VWNGCARARQYGHTNRINALEAGAYGDVSKSTATTNTVADGVDTRRNDAGRGGY
jgi:hypothetical protein